MAAFRISVPSLRGECICSGSERSVSRGDDAGRSMIDWCPEPDDIQANAPAEFWQ